MNTFINVAVPFALLAGGLFLLSLAFLHIYDRRLIENMPTSKCRSVALGPAELSGLVAAPKPINSLIAQIPCVCSRVSVEQYRRQGRSESWVTVHKQEFKLPFFIEDGSGRIQVDPHDAQLDLAPDVSYSSQDDSSQWNPHALDRSLRDPSGFRSLSELLRDYCTLRGISLDAPTRFTETNLCPGDPVYVIGTVMANGSTTQPAIVIRSAIRCPLFVSERGEQEVVRFLARRARLCLSAGALLSIAAIALMLRPAPFSVDTRTPVALVQSLQSCVPYLRQASSLAALLLAPIALTVYFILIYNGLVMLRNEVNRAWANTDVLLQQRFDLIPNLVEVCKGYMRHEQTVLQEATSTRTHWTQARHADKKVEAAEDSSAALHEVFACSEKYPSLRANETFASLQKTIADLETQISDRRELYNAAVAAYNMRIADIPDTWVARAFDYTPRPYFAPKLTKPAQQSTTAVASHPR